MNLYTADYNLSGELLAIVLIFFSHFMIFAVLPTLSLYVLTRNVEQLKSKDFKNCRGEIYEGIKIERIYQRSYNLVFISRRFLYLAIVTFIQDPKKAGIQIILLLNLNLATGLYIISSKSQLKKILNQIELVNEYAVFISTSIMILFTDYVLDSDL